MEAIKQLNVDEGETKRSWKSSRETILSLSLPRTSKGTKSWLQMEWLVFDSRKGI